MPLFKNNRTTDAARTFRGAASRTIHSATGQTHDNGRRLVQEGGLPVLMTAVSIRQHGTVEVMEYTDYLWSVPIPEEGHVVVRNDYAGLNFLDCYYRSGLYEKPLPFILGTEGGGTVVQIHPSVHDVEVGDAVVYMSPHGSYAEYTLVSVEKLVKVPAELSMEAALCGMLQGLTAHYLVTDATGGLVKAGDWMLIYGVGSGTGQWAAQMAKLQGYKVIGTTSYTKRTIVASASWLDALIVLPPPTNIHSETSNKNNATSRHADYHLDHILPRVMEITQGKGVKCILDGIGKATVDISMACLATRGLWISFGSASGPLPPLNVAQWTSKSAYCTRPKLGDYVSDVYDLRSRAQEVFGWISQGLVDVRVDLILPLQNVQEGHAYLEAGRSRGKILFRIRKDDEDDDSK